MQLVIPLKKHFEIECYIVATALFVDFQNFIILTFVILRRRELLVFVPVV